MAYLPPFILPRTEMAERTFGDCINSDSHQFGEHPDDYTLFDLGTFDDETAQYDLKTPQSLGNGVDFIRNPPPTENSDAEAKDRAQTKVSNGSSIQSGT